VTDRIRLTELTGLSRRHFLALGVAFAAPLLPGIARLVPLAGRTADPTTAALLARVADLPASARPVGRAYLAAAPGEANVQSLCTCIVDLLPAGSLTDEADAEEVRVALSALVRDDFRAQRVVVVEGWILSVTEARLYGLAALT
jgi:hypothetical protein